MEQYPECASVGDGFSFRPQREKCSTKPLQLSPPRVTREPVRQRHKKAFGSYGRQDSQFMNFPLLEYTDHIQAQMDIEEHFNKQFSFTHRTNEDGSVNWVLPSADRMYTSPVWKDDTLQAMKMSLNHVKKQLGEKDIAVWHNHTSNTNPSQKISYAVKRRAQPEMVTQAWLKFYEIVNAYPIVPLDVEGEEGHVPFNSVHLCEAPGAFILALNHYLALNRWSLKWQWLGNSLNPYYEGISSDQCISEDRFIFLTLKNWAFGKDNTGDLMARNNLDDILERSKALGSIHLVTADGSVDCQANPGEQEETTHVLHLCEVIAGLCLLVTGGALVIKKFTFFESESVCLMYLLSCLFQEIHVYKPGTSKQGNSEVYVVALGYIGRDACKEQLGKLMEVYGARVMLHTLYAREDIPEAFMKQIYTCSEFFKRQQENSIARNLSLFPKMHEREKQYNELLKVKGQKLFFDRNYCTTIPKWMTITEGNVNRSRHIMENDWSKIDNASLVRNNTVKEKFKIVVKFLEEYIEDNSSSRGADNGTNFAETKSSYYFTSPLLEEIEYKVIKGKPFHTVSSTKFCPLRVFKIYRELYEMWQITNSSKKILGIDDSLVAKVVEEHDKAHIIREETALGPHSSCRALEQIVVLLETGSIPVGGSVILVDIPLLTRLQCGLLMVVECAFTNVLLYTPKEIGSQAPVIVLQGLKSMDMSEAVIRSLYHTGLSPDGGSGGSGGALQIVAYPSLLQEDQYNVFHHYNMYYYIHCAQLLCQNIEID